MSARWMPALANKDHEAHSERHQQAAQKRQGEKNVLLARFRSDSSPKNLFYLEKIKSFRLETRRGGKIMWYS
jgi:hypothetical protein